MGHQTREPEKKEERKKREKKRENKNKNKKHFSGLNQRDTKHATFHFSFSHCWWKFVFAHLPK